MDQPFSPGLVVAIAVLLIVIAALLAWTVSDAVKRKRLWDSFPLYMQVRKSILARIAAVGESGKTYFELADPSSGKTLEIIPRPTGLEDLFFPRLSEIRIRESSVRPSDGCMYSTTLIHRFPSRLVNVPLALLIEDERMTKDQRKEARRDAWQNASHATLEQLQELERALTHWRPVGAEKWNTRRK